MACSGAGARRGRNPKSCDKVVLDVPFEGDPGLLAEKSFHGRASLFVDSSEKDADIPDIINTILDIK
jgi:hypothetical protein